jgi:NAD(P)-dependent dehydrogenase (short-subunit alcohol dehydrogenase family)
VIHFFPRPNYVLSDCLAPGIVVARLVLLAKHLDHIVFFATNSLEMWDCASHRSRCKLVARAGVWEMRSVVITGASTGIGWATAKLLLDRGFRVFGSVRKPADADRLKGEFGANFIPLRFDVTDEAAVLAAAREVRAVLAGETLAGLVNNAGIAVAGPVLEVSADEFRRQMEVNVIGPIIAIQAFGPLLGSDPSLKGPRGKVVMISSVAGRSGNPLSSAYSASKHAIEGLSESLRREMMLFGIDVIIVAPGAVKTPIWGKADGVDISAYKNSPYLPALERVRQFLQHLSEIALPPERIAARIADVLTSADPRVRYEITPDPMRHLIMGMLPKRMVDRIIAKRLGLLPPA